MTLFHEIYGTYFRIAARVLENESITEKALREIVSEEGFRDSVLFVPQRLIPQDDGSDWGLLRKIADGKFTRVTKNAPEMPLTLLQKRWLKAKLSDPKMQLFLDDETLRALHDKLKEIKPLWEPEMFRSNDRFSDGDNFADSDYRLQFRKIVRAIRRGEVLFIRFTSGHGQRLAQRFLPLALEYSGKNDKFRLYCRGVRGDRLSGGGIVNLGRIETLSEAGVLMREWQAAEQFFALRRCKTPVTVRVTPERNGVERFFMEFSAYEKHTERDLESGCCTVQLWYDRQDETELLIRLLSFGPVLEILSPEDFREQAAERVRKQYKLLDAQGIFERQISQQSDGK